MTYLAATNPAGLDRNLSTETIWLMNRDAIADRYGCTPVEIEGWPSYEVQVALKLLNIRNQADSKRPKRKAPPQ